MRCPAAIPAIALCAGISAGIFVFPPVSPAVPFLFLLTAIAVFATPRRLSALNLEGWTVGLITCGFFFAGVVLGQYADSASRNQPLRALFDRHIATFDRHVAPTVAQDLSPANPPTVAQDLSPANPPTVAQDFSPANQFQLFANIEGRLRRDAVKGPAGVTLDVQIDAIELGGELRSTSGGALIGVGGELTSDRILQWRGGRRVAFPATLRAPTKYLDPGVADGERQLAWRGVALVGSVKSDRLVEVTAHGSLLTEALSATRAAVRRAVAVSVAPWSARSAAVVSAILIGDRAGLDTAVERRLQEAGTYHVIAISGGNIAILAGLCICLLRISRFGARSSAALVIIMLTAYAFVVEGGSSVARATLMAAIYFAAVGVDHRIVPLNVAALTTAILLCVDPLQLVDAGFALTFGATLGILIGMSKLADVLPTFALRATAGKPAARWLRAPALLLLASACAEIVLLPVSAFVFSRITFAGLIVNLAAIPLMTIVQIAGMAAVALAWAAPALAIWIGWIAHLAVEGLIGSAALVDVFPWLTRRLAPPSLWVVTAYYGSLLAVVRAIRARLATTMLVVAAIWIIAAPVLPPRPQLLRVTFLDVGQGDAAVAQFPDGRTLSIDAGGLAAATFDIGGRVVAPALWALGVRRLDYMSVTHGDIDHIGGAASLFRDFKPIEVWEGVPVPPHVPTRELRELADRAGSVWRTLQPADRVSFGAVDLIVHHPPYPDWERQRVRNDDSEVIELRYGGASFVFTGDIGREVERTIAPSFARAPIRILKVPHHGSATSSSQLFLSALRPDIAIISAGRGNPFGHPVPAVLERYRNIGAAIYRTDKDGAVTVETDGTTVRVRTFTGRQLTLTTHGR